MNVAEEVPGSLLGDVDVVLLVALLLCTHTHFPFRTVFVQQFCFFLVHLLSQQLLESLFFLQLLIKVLGNKGFIYPFLLLERKRCM